MNRVENPTERLALNQGSQLSRTDALTGEQSGLEVKVYEDRKLVFDEGLSLCRGRRQKANGQDRHEGNQAIGTSEKLHGDNSWRRNTYSTSLRNLKRIRSLTRGREM